MKIAAIAHLFLCFVMAASAQLAITPLPDILFQNNSGVHNIVEQSVIWLYCTADSANATITWTKDGVTLVNDPAHIRIRSSRSGMSTTSSLVVDNFQTSDNGDYVCQARDGMMTAGSSTLNFTASTSTRTVTSPTDNDMFPVDNRTTVTVGNTHVLRCAGTGSFSPPSVVWVRNGEQVINGGNITITEGTDSFTQQTNSQLQITNFGLSDAGVYQCIFTEGAEVITTTPLRLDTGDNMLERVSPRVIVLDPPEKLVIETRASGGYQMFDWNKNGNEFTLTPGRPFTVTLQEFLNFFEIFVREPTTTNDLGVYWVDIVGGQPQIPEIQFAVTPYSAPTVMNLNGTVTIQEGDSINITCNSTGNPVPTISWYLGTSPAPFSQSDSVQNFEATIVRDPMTDRPMLRFSEGNITSVLQITNAVYPAHDGEYTCVGLNSNRAGNRTDNATITVQVQAVNGQLTVTPLPDILFQNNSGDHNIVEQSVIWLYCTADSANATITWTKDGVTLVNDPAHIRIRSSNSGMSTTSSLVVDNFQTPDNGNYVCQARDGMMTVNSSTLNLTASTSTRTVTNPTDNDIFSADNRIAVSVGGSQTLSCAGAGSSSPPSVVWVRNGEQVINGGNITITEGTDSFTRQTNSELSITNFALSDAGVYQCIFTEGAEVVTTTPLRLDTGDNMLERVSPRVIVLDPPEKLVIETRASGGYQQFDWTRNGNPFTLAQGQPFTVTLQEFSNFFEIFVREPTTADDLGVYEVDLVGGSVSQVPEIQFAVTPYSAPTIMNLNGTVTVQEGDLVNIACFSSGNPVPTISWYLGTSLAPFLQIDTVEDFRAEIVGSISIIMLDFAIGNITSVLQITNAVYPAHDGEYTCVGLNSNRAGDNTNNATITVQVQVPPEVEVSATLTRVVVGNSTTLTCTVTRSNPMGSYTYTWVHNNSMIPGETSSMLTVGILTESDVGIYHCEVTNSAGLNGSNTTTIELGNPPRGTVIQPVPPVVLSQSVDLMCTATGESSITYTWVLMGEENTRLNSDPTSGNFTLTITQVNQYGLYICITTNNLGTDAANIIIIQATIPMTPPDQTVEVTVGSALTLMVNITGFNLPLTSITWMEDGQVLMNNTDNIIITHGSFAAPPTTSTLVRDPIQSPMDNGTYQVTVMNPAGESMTTFTVIVNAPVEILSPQEPTAISVNETYPVSVVCSARGFPAVDITWRYQNTQLMDSDPRLNIQSMTVENNNGIFNTTSTLTIPSVDRSDAGNYTCVASNTLFGSPASEMQQFMLTVNFSVTLLGDPMDVDVLSPAPAVLNCTATGKPTPQFTWTKVFPNGTTVEVSESMSNINISTTLSGENVTSTLTIGPTGALDTANYSCTAENTFGPVTSSEAEVTVFVAPELVTPVEGEMFRVNRTDDIRIQCSARGIPPPFIRFLRRGVELNRTGGESGVGMDLASRVQLGGESSSVFVDDGTFMVSRMLTIFNVAEEDGGNFTCEAASTIPELGLSLSDSSVFELIVQIPGTISVPPMDTTVVSPSPAVFTCEADGVSTPVITWWRRDSSNSLTQLSSDGINVTISDRNFDSRTRQSNLTILQPQPVDAAEYVCRANNEIASDTASAVLTVYVEPTFLFPLENFTETVNETDSVTFVCVVVGIPPPNIGFYQNGTLLNQSTDQRITLTDNSELQDFQTATGTVFHVNRSLTLDNTTDADYGTYTCVAFNAAANVTQDFELVVQVAPQILDPPDNLTVVEPQDATFSCMGTGRPRPDIVWTRLSDMVQLQNQSGVYRIEEWEIGDRERRSNLTILGSQPSDTGGYACVARNEPGSVMLQATLTVHVVPNITFPPDGLVYTVNETDPVTFTCSATGIPPPEITWMRNGVTLDRNVDLRISLGNPSDPELVPTPGGNISSVSRSLTNSNTRDNDSDNYTCVASNGNAVTPSVTQNFTLVVQVAPQIIDPPDDLTVVEPQDATFSCLATGRPRPTIVWTRLSDMVQLQNQSGDVMIEEQEIGDRERRSMLTILGSQPSDAGGYACGAVNEPRSVMLQATLTVYVVPNITFPVDDGFTYTVNETDPVTFTCSATGIPPPEITWMRNGVVLNESADSRISLGNPSDPETVPTAGGNISTVSRSLTISSTRDNDSDNYTCVASNGNTVTPNVTQNFGLFVNVAPTILEPPVNLTVVQPHSATFLCNATARPRPEITWWRMGSQLMEQPGVIEISNSTFGEREIVSNLIIIMADPSDAGGYACNATNAAGQDTAAAELTVHVIPNITFPVDDGFTYTVNENDPVTFTCSATGIPPPEITWMRNGAPFNESNTRVTLSDPTMPELVSTGGENIYFVSRNLTLDNTMDADSGTYTCVASNRNAVDLTDVQNFELFVRVAPTILEPPENLTVVQPQSATFLCNATARPRPEITWWRMGSQLMEQPGVIEISTSTFGEREIVSNLTIIMADPSDAGGYACNATNAAGQDTAVAELTVHVIPNITFPVDDGFTYTVNENDPVTFTCSATGIPPPEITWMRNGAPFDQSITRVTLSDPTMPELLSTGGGNIYFVSRNLTLDNTMDADSGTYTCVASNGNAVDPTDMQNFELFVRVSPTILEPPENLTVVQPQSATFLCNATARPRPEITWWRMGSQLMEQTGVTEIITSTFGEREIVSNLTIIMADSSDAGRYACNATNVAGQDTAAAELTVHVIPEIIFPNDSFAGYIVNVTDPITFGCIATGIPPPTIQWFRDGVLLSSHVTLSEPSQTMVSAPMGTGMIYQVKRTLTFTTTANDTGTYACKASNINMVRPTVTQNFGLFVQVPPIVVSLAPGRQITGNETESATFSFRIDNAAPPVLHEALRWFYVADFRIDDPFAGQEITNLMNRTTVSRLTFSDYTNIRYINLTVSNIVQQRVGIGGETDEGRYFLVAANPAGINFNYIDFLVYGRPLIFVPPVDQFEINNGSSAVFQCKASAVPEHDVFWTFTNSDGSTLSIISTAGSDTNKYQIKQMRGIGAGFGELTVLDVQYGDRGRYTCIAMNSVGSDVSDASLTVHVYPIINNVSGLTEVNVSRPATLVCLTTGFPLPSITWQKDGGEVMLTMDGRISTFSFNVSNSSSESNGFMGSGSVEGVIETMTEFNMSDISSLGELGVVSVLSFGRLERGDTANYTCTATNVLPQTTTLTALSPSIPLVVLEVPDPPINVMVFDMGARWLALWWAPTFDGNRPIRSFLVNLQNINLTSPVSLGTLQASNLMFRDGNFMYNVTTGILPFTNYNFNVRACNLLGCGNESQTSPTVMSLPDVPTAPRDVTLSNITQTSIMVAWEEPTIPHGILGPYNVSYTGTKSYNSTFRDTGSRSESGQVVVLTGLTSDTNYSIVVIATNIAGFRNISEAVVGATLSGPPPPINEPPLTGTQVGGSLTITLRVARASNLGGQISHYQVIVVLLPSTVSLTDLREPDMQFPSINSFGTYSDINCGNPGTNAIAYITAEFGDNLFPSNNMFIVGDLNQPNDRPDNYTNGQLCYATNYTFFVRAYTVNLMQQRGRRSALGKRQASVEQRQYTLFSSTPYTNVTSIASESTTALFQLRLKPVRECVTWVDERRAQKFMDIVSAVVQEVQMRCSCSFTETNIRNNEFSCRSIENTVVFRAEISYTGLQQARYRAENLVTLVSGWAQSGTSIVVDSTRLDVDPTCPTQLGSFQDGDCELTDTPATDTTSTETTGTDSTATVGGNVATFASLGVVVGVVCVLLIICSIIIIIFVVQKKRKHRTFSPTDETYELPQLPTDDSIVKANPARSENVITSSNPAYGHFQISRQEHDTKEEEKGKRWKQGTFSPADETYEVPELSLQSSRQGNDTEEDEEEDHTYEPLPFDTPRQ